MKDIRVNFLPSSFLSKMSSHKQTERGREIDRVRQRGKKENERFKRLEIKTDMIREKRFIE